MGKLTKNQKLALSKIEPGRLYTLAEAAEKVKEVNYAKFDASFDIDVRLGADPRKADQMVRGVVSPPTEQASRFACSCFAHPTQKLPQRKPVPTM